MYQPLADLLRPQTLDEVYGQEHILGENAVLRRLVESGKIPNMVFYGPSGTGKTTVANIIAKQTNRTLYKLNATTASTADIREIVSQLDTFMAPNGVLLYLDEIQSFNKKQQQSLLEHIENGKITLIASTTENPYFYVFNAILSRSTVFEFKQISSAAALQAVKRAVAFMEQRTALQAVPEKGTLEYIAGACGVTLATYGRPGLFLRATNDPACLQWEDRMELIHSSGERDTPGSVLNRATCSYTDMIPLDDHTAGLAYSDFTIKDENGVPRKTMMFRTITVEP